MSDEDSEEGCSPSFDARLTRELSVHGSRVEGKSKPLTASAIRAASRSPGLSSRMCSPGLSSVASHSSTSDAPTQLRAKDIRIQSLQVELASCKKRLAEAQTKWVVTYEALKRARKHVRKCREMSGYVPMDSDASKAPTPTAPRRPVLSTRGMQTEDVPVVQELVLQNSPISKRPTLGMVPQPGPDPLVSPPKSDLHDDEEAIKRRIPKRHRGVQADVAHEEDQRRINKPLPVGHYQTLEASCSVLSVAQRKVAIVPLLQELDRAHMYHVNRSSVLEGRLMAAHDNPKYTGQRQAINLTDESHLDRSQFRLEMVHMQTELSRVFGNHLMEYEKGLWEANIVGKPREENSPLLRSRIVDFQHRLGFCVRSILEREKVVLKTKFREEAAVQASVFAPLDLCKACSIYFVQQPTPSPLRSPTAGAFSPRSTTSSLRRHSSAFGFGEPEFPKSPKANPSFSKSPKHGQSAHSPKSPHRSKWAIPESLSITIGDPDPLSSPPGTPKGATVASETAICLRCGDAYTQTASEEPAQFRRRRSAVGQRKKGSKKAALLNAVLAAGHMQAAASRRVSPKGGVGLTQASSDEVVSTRPPVGRYTKILQAMIVAEEQAAADG